MKRRIITALITLAILGCDDPTDPGRFCVCTADFRTITFTLVNRQGNPEAGAAVFVLQLRTQQLFDIAQPDSGSAVYSVANDSFKNRLRASGDTLLVLGAKDSRRFATNFVVGVGEPCRCHVYKVAGPDSVVLE